MAAEEHEGRKANRAIAGKAPSDRPALKPYRGKPAVRNFRGGNGNVGIIRSPVRAIALPDSSLGRAAVNARVQLYGQLNGLNRFVM